MIQQMTHTPIFVDDHDRAIDFYVGKLGFELKTDQTLPGGFRWVTVAPKGQAFEIILMKIAPFGHLQEEDVADLRRLVKKGVLGAGVMGTADCRKTYEELSAKGVEFTSPPKDQFYGIEAVFKDPFGNWFSLTQPK
jgi:catechol 2,3-dioxygenase-like lactoylglutathione lyase family enzyme